MSEDVSHKSQDELYFVVRNHEEQYSIWRSDKPVPAGWETVEGPAGKEDCLSRIDEIWTDMRPASLRAAMAAAENGKS
ncbi:MbtH family NRPS accessory protein [Streptomyces sp. NPDC002793]|uniref:MbtH family protein n=1 Tax=Streptomyces sp. NPDC002793 TaxID=3154432 RepID=UPI00332F8568